MLKVKKIFHSIQGEGLFTGQLTTFIRLGGCNVKCNIRKYCDTNFDNGFKVSEEFILAKMKNKIVCITGGEPLEQDIKKLCFLLRTNGFQVHIQTSGVLDISKDLIALTNHIVCSPKLPVDKLKLSKVDEIKVVNAGQDIKQYYKFSGALYHYIQPLEKNGEFNNYKTIKKLEEITTDQKWSLSLQIHKILGVD